MAAAEDAPALALDGVAAGYGKRAIVDGVGLTVRPGEILGLIGLNGAGKTTLLKAVLDLHFLSAGAITVFGTPHTDPASRRHLAFLPERLAPAPMLKGREWLRLTLAPYGQGWDRSAADRMCEALALDPAALDRRVATYSKGMAQKLGLASALLARRALLVLDEPLSGLDPLARLRLKEALLAERAQGTAVCFSSHILADVAALCDRVAVLHDGRIAFTGTPAELCERHGRADLDRAFLNAIGGGEVEGQLA